MVQKRKPKLKKAKITTIGTMNFTNSTGNMGLNAEIDHPNVGKTGSNENTRKPFWVRNMALVQTKPARFLVRKKSFDTHPTPIPVVGFIGKLKTGNQVDRFVALFVPDDDNIHRAKGFFCHQNIGKGKLTVGKNRNFTNETK